jgi:ABC-type glycerol-3-phosphate transport system permease component
MTRRRGRWSRAGLYAVLTVFGLLFLIPFVWILSTSLKGNEQIFTIPPEWIPSRFRWENYAEVFRRMPVLLYLKNSVIVTVLQMIGIVGSSSLVAYAFAILRWPGRNMLFGVLLATMMLPMQVTMIPVFVLFKQFGWLDTFKPLVVPAFLGGGAFNIFLLRQFFLGVPREIADAARIDGCSEFRIYWNIMIPLAKPALATVAIMTFMFSWNDFLGPLIYLSEKEKSTLALGLSMFVGQQTNEWALLMASSLLMLIPMIAIFFFFQKYIIQGFTMTGIKG